jgi:hypothetical protein
MSPLNESHDETGATFVEVSSDHACQVCQKQDWCSCTEDGVWGLCRRVDNHPVFGVGEELTDVAGAPYWRYRLIQAGNAGPTEAPGVLARAVQGGLDRQQKDLGLHEEVPQAAPAERTQQDVLGNYLDECCHTGPAYTGERARVLYGAFQLWSEVNGKPCASQHRFGKALKGRGFKSRPSNGVVYDGIQVKPAWRVMVEARDRRKNDAKRAQESG